MAIRHNLSNLHSKPPSAIGRAFKRVGADWKEDFARAVIARDWQVINMYMKLLPFLVVTGGKDKPPKRKAASADALQELTKMESATPQEQSQ